LRKSGSIESTSVARLTQKEAQCLAVGAREPDHVVREPRGYTDPTNGDALGSRGATEELVLAVAIPGACLAGPHGCCPTEKNSQVALILPTIESKRQEKNRDGSDFYGNFKKHKISQNARLARAGAARPHLSLTAACVLRGSTAGVCRAQHVDHGNTAGLQDESQLQAFRAELGRLARFPKNPGTIPAPIALFEITGAGSSRSTGLHHRTLSALNSFQDSSA
jgi:hypothetical protein